MAFLAALAPELVAGGEAAAGIGAAEGGGLAGSLSKMGTVSGLMNLTGGKNKSSSDSGLNSIGSYSGDQENAAMSRIANFEIGAKG